MEIPTLDLFQSAGLTVRRASERTYRASIDCSGLSQAAFYKPREIPMIVENGTFDLGITGADWLEESGVKVEVVHGFPYSKATGCGWRVVLAVPEDHVATTPLDLSHGVRVAAEYPNIAWRYFQELGVEAEVIRSYGATEAKIPEVADVIVDVAETGSSLRHNNLRILDTIRHCDVKVIANPAAWVDNAKRRVIEEVMTLLQAAHAGPAHRLLTILIPADRWDDVAPLLPTRWWTLNGGASSADMLVMQAVFGVPGIATAITALTAAGAVGIVETAITKLVSS